VRAASRWTTESRRPGGAALLIDHGAGQHSVAYKNVHQPGSQCTKHGGGLVSALSHTDDSGDRPQVLQLDRQYPFAEKGDIERTPLRVVIAAADIADRKASQKSFRSAWLRLRRSSRTADEPL